MNKELLKGNSELLILELLSKKPLHGYAISEALQRAFPGMFQFGVGMLYPLLHKLEKQGLVSGSWEQVIGADRKVYRLTKRGKRECERRTADWLVFSKKVTRFVGARS